MMIYDIIIVGAGPAGLMAARHLSKANMNFLVIDSKKEIGKPLRCGEGIREKEFLEFFKHKNYSFIENLVTEHEVIYKKFIRRFKENFFQLNRTKFEKWLAKNLGKKLKLGTACKDIKIKKNNAEVITSKGIFKTRMVILANGCNFELQKKFGLVRKRPNIVVGYGGIYRINKINPNKFYYFFDDRYLGYLWIFPKSNNLANIGFGAANVKNPGKVLRELLGKFGIKGKQLVQYVGIIPCLGPINKTYYDRLLVCGTAAGHVYAGTGEGIYYALKSGQIAAQTATKAVEKNRFDTSFLKRYEKEWKKTFGKQMKAGIIFADLLYLGFKFKRLKELFKQPTEKELRAMIIKGEIPFRARIAWYTARLFNLKNKEKIPSVLKIIARKIISS